MASNSAQYSIGDLAGLVGSTPRTIRYYVAQGLLPPPEGAGAGAHYTDDHLGRLRLIQRLQRQHQPLSEIRKGLARLGPGEVSALVADGEPEGPTGSALDYVRSVLARPETTISRPEPPQLAPLPAPPDATAPPPGPPIAPPGARPVASLLHRENAARRLFGAPSIALPDDVVSMPRVQSRLAEAAPGYPSHADDGTDGGLPVADVPAAANVPAAAGTPGADIQTPEQRSQWDRIGLTPNIEIHVRRPLSRLENRRVERLITIARHMLREEKP